MKKVLGFGDFLEQNYTGAKANVCVGRESMYGKRRIIKKLLAMVLTVIFLAATACSKPDGGASTETAVSRKESSDTEKSDDTESTVLSETDNSQELSTKPQQSSGQSSKSWTSSQTTQITSSEAKSTASVRTTGETTKTFQELSGIAAVKGRCSASGSGVTMDWTGSGFLVKGTLSGKVSLSVRQDQGEKAYLQVVVDGNYEKETIVFLSRGLATYTLVTDLKEGLHTVEVTKRTEATKNILTALSLTFTGNLIPVSLPSRRIEIVGDSLACGLANEDAGAEVLDSNKSQDGAYSFGVLTARDLQADYRVIGISGWGAAAGSENKSWRVPLIYEKISFRRSDTTMWNFQSWQPDVVVIALGTNDDNYRRRGNTLSDEEFFAGVREMVLMAKKNNPKAELFWGYGMMNRTMEPLLKTALEQILNNDGIHVHYVALPTNTLGGYYHSNELGHRQAADVLSEAIRKVMKW